MTNLNMQFEPEPNDEPFITASNEYTQIWKDDGEKIVQKFEELSGCEFYEENIKAIVYVGISRSGVLGDAMHLRASYPHNTKKATLIHELGHRLFFGFEECQNDYDAEQINDLIIYDVWTDLYGKKFADEQILVEKARKGVYDYESAWNWALSLERDGRKELFNKIREDFLRNNS